MSGKKHGGKGMRMLKRIADNPWLNIVAGAMLLIIGIVEMIDTLVLSLFGVEIGMEHGLAIIGGVQLLKAIPDALKGLKFVEEGEDARSETVSMRA
jgi:hypothetical protein